jgi:hypothetical protein
MHSELDPATYGLTIWDLDREFLTDGLAGTTRKMALGDILARAPRRLLPHASASSTCTSQEPEQKAWIQQHVEGTSRQDPAARRPAPHPRHGSTPPRPSRSFLATKYLGQKRFGIEGAESAIPILDAVLERGRQLRPPRRRASAWPTAAGSTSSPTSWASATSKLFTEFEGYIDPESTQGSGDVKYHLGQTGASSPSRTGEDHRPIELAANPSHLETVDPVVVGMARAKPGRDQRPHAPSRCCRSSLHGDAAFAGQGVVAETLNLLDHQGLPRRRHRPPHHQQPARASPHSPDSARSSEYCTDVAKMVQAPIFHVNGDDPEACVRVARLAYDYRQTVPQGRRHRHGLLPPARPQRGRRPQLHPAPHVQAHRRPPLGAQALHRGARPPRRHLGRGGRAGPRRLLRPAGHRPRRDPLATPPSPRSSGQAAVPPAHRCAARTSTPASRPRTSSTAHLPEAVNQRPEGFDRSTPSSPSSSTPATKMVQGGEVDWAHGRGPGLRLAAARGHRHPPGRPGLAPRHLLPPPQRSSSDYETGAEHAPLAHLGARPGARSTSTTRCCQRVRRPRLRVRLLGHLRRQDALVLLGGAVRRLRQRRP